MNLLLTSIYQLVLHRTIIKTNYPENFADIETAYLKPGLLGRIICSSS